MSFINICTYNRIECYSALKRKGILAYAIIWNLKGIMPGEPGQKLEDTLIQLPRESESYRQKAEWKLGSNGCHNLTERVLTVKIWNSLEMDGGDYTL